MTKKQTPKTKITDDVPLDHLVQQTLREAVVQIRTQIASGDIVATNIQALVALDRRLQRRDEGDAEDLDRRVRALDPKARLDLLREWNQLDSKRSGLA